MTLKSLCALLEEPRAFSAFAEEAISHNVHRSTLLPPRQRDSNQSGFHDWPFLTVHTWGEDPRGTWTLIIENVGSSGNHGTYVSSNLYRLSTPGTFHSWNLRIYGTAEPAQPTDPRHSDEPSNPVGVLYLYVLLPACYVSLYGWAVCVCMPSTVFVS